MKIVKNLLLAYTRSKFSRFSMSSQSEQILQKTIKSVKIDQKSLKNRSKIDRKSISPKNFYLGSILGAFWTPKLTSKPIQNRSKINTKKWSQKKPPKTVTDSSWNIQGRPWLPQKGDKSPYIYTYIHIASIHIPYLRRPGPKARRILDIWRVFVHPPSLSSIPVYDMRKPKWTPQAANRKHFCGPATSGEYRENHPYQRGASDPTGRLTSFWRARSIWI